MLLSKFEGAFLLIISGKAFTTFVTMPIQLAFHLFFCLGI